MEVRLIYEHIDYLVDVQDIPKAFSPYLTVNENSNHFLKWEYKYKDGIFNLYISSDIFKNKTYSEKIEENDLLEFRRASKRFIKKSIYDFLKEELQIRLPYGSLTGVRPTKLYYKLTDKTENIANYLVEEYDVLPQKAKLIADCVHNQEGFINKNKNNVGLFINIPICPTRCKYCSFISTEIFRIKNRLDFYVDCVKKELFSALEIIDKNGYKIKSVYVGGGTPTCIGANRLKSLLEPISSVGCEFTVEAGRPDAIDEDIVGALSDCGVTRVSVNPQSFCDATLALVGRMHTVDDFYRAYDLMSKAKFTVNTDLIAGLPQENFNTFENSINKCIELNPDNITVHALSLKRGSVFTSDGMKKGEFGIVEKMIDYAHSALSSAGYVPYYMYRQKNMADNLENTGYALPGKQCVYNIDMMEESASIIGVGAGAMSKKITDDKIARFSAPKGFNEYCDRIDKTVRDRESFFVL